MPAPLSPLRAATSGFLSDTWLITSIIHERYKELIFNELATVRGAHERRDPSRWVIQFTPVCLWGRFRGCTRFLRGEWAKMEGKEGVGRLNLYMYLQFDRLKPIDVDISRKLYLIMGFVVDYISVFANR